LAVVGRSGTGKTTLLRLIAGAVIPQRGEVRLIGADPAAARRAKRIGFVGQNAALHPWRTVVQNIRLPLDVNPADVEDGPTPEEWVARIGLAAAANAYPHQLSGGMRQRVALARSLVADPAILLMDEPLSSLDELTRDDLRLELVDFWGATRTVVYVTHDIEEAVWLADRVAVLGGHPARIAGIVPVALERPRTPALRRDARFLDLIAGAAMGVIAIALEIWTAAFHVPGYLVPAPSAVGARLVADWAMFLREAAVTIAEASMGFLVGTTVAFAIASAMVRSRVLERTLFPLAILVKLTPIVAVAPLFTLWFGFGSAPKVAIAALITFFPMVVNAFVGLRSADPQEVAFLETLGATRTEVFRHLRVPNALPYLFSGARISLNLALIGAVIGEWTGADHGLGRVILVANANLDLATLFAAVLLLAAIGIAANALVGTVERRVLHWHPVELAA